MESHPTNSGNNEAVPAAAARETAAPAPPLTPKLTNPRSADANPFPTTFIQVETSSFKQVVQMLTGSPETAAATTNPPAHKGPTPPAAKVTGPKKPAFKLYDRRSSSLKIINPLKPAFSPRNQPEILSPSTLDFPSLALSPVTPLIADPFNRSPAATASAEDRTIAEKGFYLHPSPRTALRDDVEPPRLLPLFPVTSPGTSSSSAPTSPRWD